MYVCMYVCMNLVCMYVVLYVCLFVRRKIILRVCICIYLYVCMCVAGKYIIVHSGQESGCSKSVRIHHHMCHPLTDWHAVIVSLNRQNVYVIDPRNHI